MKNNTAFESFNARYLSFHQVAESFIPNHFFDALLLNSHSLLMGPRGCGKTTLLKMLTPPALSYWDGKRKTSRGYECPFWGVYIPSDIHWKKQLERVRDILPESDAFKIVSKSTITLNILLSLVKTFRFIQENLSTTTEEENSLEEIKLSKILIDSWELKKPIAPTFESIEFYLLKKVSSLNTIINKLLYTPNYSPDFDKLDYTDFYDLIRIGCEAFDKIFFKNPIKKWAFCFDELEIAPEWLQTELLSYLRSRDQNIIFKLTTAPIIPLLRKIKHEYMLDASEHNDFNVVKVWTTNQRDFKFWKTFSSQLIKERIRRKFGKKINPEEIFGTSFLERIIKYDFPERQFGSDENFTKNSPTWAIFRELAKVDLSFREFLERKDIDPLNPVPKKESQKSAIFRKIKQIVVYRYQFIKEGQNKRSRKLVSLYYGIPLIYELADGNPRILIWIIDELLEKCQDGNGQFRPLNINEQSRTINEISKKYLQILSSHPDANIIIKGKDVNLKDIIEKIGFFFHEKMSRGSFTMDPTGSFIVDQNINNKYVELLELGVYLGALVYLDDEESISSTGIEEKRIRLSYTLSPHFGLLSRDFKEINLSKIVSVEDRLDSPQRKLF